MEKKYRLEPFDIERAKAGEPVCTRDKEDVKILCYERNDIFPIVTLRGKDDKITSYTSDGKNCIGSEISILDLMMKVEIKETYVFAEVAGEIISFEEAKTKLGDDIEDLEYLIIKTHDGKFLKIWKRDVREQEWEDTQKLAEGFVEKWRWPTRHECIDIYDARFKGLDEAMKEIGGDPFIAKYWTSEADSDPKYTASHALYFNGASGYLTSNSKRGLFCVRCVSGSRFQY